MPQDQTALPATAAASEIDERDVSAASDAYGPGPDPALPSPPSADAALLPASRGPGLDEELALAAGLDELQRREVALAERAQALRDEYTELHRALHALPESSEADRQRLQARIHAVEEQGRRVARERSTLERDRRDADRQQRRFELLEQRLADSMKLLNRTRAHLRAAARGPAAAPLPGARTASAASSATNEFRSRFVADPVPDSTEPTKFEPGTPGQPPIVGSPPAKAVEDLLAGGRRLRAELECERADIERRQRALARAELELERRRRALVEQSREFECRQAEVRQRGEQLARTEAELENRRARLAAAQQALETQEAEQGARVAQLAPSAGGAALPDGLAQCAEVEQVLAARWRALEAQYREAASASAALDQEQKGIAERRRRLAAQQDETQRRAASVSQQAEAIEQRNAALVERRAELDRMEQETAARGERIAEQQQTIAAVEAQLAARIAETEQRTARLAEQCELCDALEERVKERADELEESTLRLEARGAATDRTGPAITERAARVEEVAPECADEELAALWHAARQTQDAIARGQVDVAALAEPWTWDPQGRGPLEQAERKDAERAQSLATRAVELDTMQAALAQRGQALEREEAELERRRAAQGTMADELTTRADELERWGAELESRARALEAQERELSTRAEALQRRQSELTAATDSLDALESQARQAADTLAQRREELAELEAQHAQVRQAHRQAAQELEQLQTELAWRRAETAEAVRRWATQRDAAAAELGRLEERSRLLAEQLAVLDQREAALANRSAELDASQGELRAAREELQRAREAQEAARAALADEHTALDQARGELEERRASIERLYAQAAAAAQRGREQEEAARGVRAAADQHAESLRKQALALDVERQEIEQARAQLELERGQVVALRDDYKTLIDEASAPRTAPPPRVGLRWWVRTGLISIAAGLGAALGWQRLHPPVSTVAARVTLESPLPLAAQLAELLNPQAAGAFIASESIASDWRAALRRHDLTAAPTADGRTIEVEWRTTTPLEEGNKLNLALLGFRAHVVRTVGSLPPSEELQRWESEVASAEQEIADACDAITQTQRELDGLPGAGERDGWQARMQGALADILRLEADAARQRAAVMRLEGQTPGAVAVPAEALAEALTRDPVSQEDRKELAVQAKKYHTELAVAMVLVDEPLQGLRSALATLLHAIDEQRALTPTPAIAALLEDAQNACRQLDAAAAAFAQSWAAQRSAAEQCEELDEIAKLLGIQKDAGAGVLALTSQARQLVMTLQANVDKLDTTAEAGTRGVVVSAMLRSELGKLQEKLAKLSESSRSVDPATNFRLDAAERSVRNLSARLSERREALRRQIEATLAAAAADEHQRALDAARQALRELEDQRPARVAALGEALRGLSESEPGIVKRFMLTAELRQQQERLALLESRRAALDGARPQPRGAQVSVEALRTEPAAGGAALSQVAWAGAGGAGLVWLVSIALFSGLRRRPGEDANTAQKP